MKAKFITFVRGLKKGTPPRFQSYLKSLTLLLTLLLSVNVMADVAPVNTVLWSETWTGASTGTSGNNSYTPSANYGKGTTVYNGGSVSYAQSANTVYVRNEEFAQGAKPELMLTKNQTWTISNISTCGAIELSLAYKSNNTKSSVTCSTSGVQINGSSESYTIKSTTTGGALPEKITIVFGCSGNTRIDNVELKVTQAGASKTPLTAPTGLAVSTTTATSAAVSWTAGDATNTGSYKVEYKTSSASNWTAVSPNPTTTSCTITGLTPSSTYNWRVTAIPSASAAATKDNSSAANGTNFTTEAPASHDITWYANGQQFDQYNQQEGAALTIPTDPDPATYCDGKAFVGWTASSTVAPDGTGITYVKAGDKVGATTAYYAVFADKDLSDSETEKKPTFALTNPSSLPSGWTTTATAGTSYLQMTSGNYVQNMNLKAAGILADGEVLSSAMSVVVSCGTYQTWSGDKKVTVKVDLLDASSNVLTTNNATFTSLGNKEDTDKPAISVDLPTDPTQFAGIKITVSDFVTGTTLRFKNVKLTYKVKTITYSNYTTTCAAVYEATVADGITNGSVVISKTDDAAAGAASLTGLKQGDKVYIFPTANTGYKLDAVTVNGTPITDTEGKYIYTIAEEGITVSATFALATYNITYNRDGGNWTGAEGVDSYTYGTGATLPTADDITKANNTFLGWYVTNPAEIVISIRATETGDKSFTASWLPSGARDVTYSGDEQLVYTSNPQIVDKDDASLTVTYSVNKGYTISAVAVTVNDAALTEEGEVVFNDEQLIITPTAGFTGNVSITFTVVEKMFTVTWMANKTQFKQVPIQEGSKVTLPAETPSDVISGEDTYKFQGWFTEEQYSNETTAPDYIEDNTIEPTGDVTYYAVYAMKESSIVANSYVKGSKSDLTEGQKVVIVNGNSKKALSSENLSSTQANYRKAISVTITNNKISNTNANIVWTVSLENSKYIFKQGTNYLNSTGNNLYCNGNKDTWTITAVSGNAGYTLLSTGGSKYLEYFSDYTEFTCYTGSGNAFNMDFYIPETKETIKNYRTRVAIIDHIAVSGTPVTTNLVAGETFDATGLSIDVYYKDEEPTNVTSGFTYAPTTALATTDTKVTFTYQGKTADVEISVSNTVSGIEVTTNPSKMEYTEGQQFDPAGMVVTATYDNSAERVVTGYDYEPKGDLALGDKITISFGGQTTDLGITINPATKTTVNWFVEGNAYTAGEPSTAVIPGKKITVLPTEPNACQGNQFVGWTAVDANYYNATTAPTDLFKTLDNAPTIGSETANFYAVFASEAVGTYDEKVTLTSLTAPTADKFTYAFAKSNGSNPPLWNANQAKTYVKNTLTVTSKNSRVITKIEYTYNINNGNSGAPSGATVTGNNSDNGSWDATNKTWTSSTNAATAVTLTVNGSSGNYGFTAIKVYLTGGTVLSDYSTTCLAALANPTITTPEGEYCGSVDVEITQPVGNPEGAKIMYSTNNTDWSEYTAAVNITTSGTVYAKVVKAPKETEVVSATYTIYPAYTLAQAAAAASATSQIACLTFTDLLVQARSLSEAFLKASDGQIVLLSKSSHGLSVGDKLVANDAHVTFVKAHDLLQLTSTEGIAAATTGNATTPEEKAITALVAADYGQLVKIMNVTYDATNKKFTDASSNEIAVDAKFFPSGIPTSWPDGGKFNVTGIVLTNSDKVVIAPRNTDDLESLATPLDKPTNFAVASVNSYRASYTWTAVENNAGYTLYIYDGETEIYKSTAIGKTRTDYAPTKDLEAGHTYTAKLVALGDKAEHSDSPAAEVPFTTNPNAKLNWYKGGSLYQTTYASQEKVVTPEIDPTSPCATNYENFVTWYTEEIDGQITALEASKKVKAGDAAASATTEQVYNFYAVFGKVKTPGTDKYVKVTEAQDNWKGEYLIGYDEGDDKDALTVFDGSLTTLDATSDYKTISFESDGSIAVNATNNGYNFKIEKSATEGYYTIQSASGIYIANTTAKNGMSESSTTAYKNTISWGERVDIVTGEHTTTSHLGFNSASDQLRFRYYTSDSYANLVLYKRTTTNPQYSGYITTCPQTYTITIAENAKGTVTAATMTEILKGAKVLLTAEAAAGYTKTGGAWVVKKTATSEVVEGLVGNTNYLTMPDYDVTVDYNFIAKTDNFIDNLHGNTTIEKGGANYELPTLSDFSGTTGAPSDAFKKFIGWSATSYDSGEPATEQPTILEGNQPATGATYFAVWYNQSGKYITEYCQTSAPKNLHLVEEYHKATSVRIDWNNVDGADKYHIIVMDGGANIIADADVTESLYDLSGLTPGATYYYTVKAHKNCWSDETGSDFNTKENIQSYAVTINAEGGTYEIDPDLDEDGKIQEGATVTISNIAVTDATIHYFKELTVPEATDLTEVDGSYMFTMPGKPVTINIVFAEFPKVTWMMEGKTYAVTPSVRKDDKFVVDAVQPAPATWTFKEYYKEFAGWMTNSDFENPVFATATTEVPADGLVVNGAVAKSADIDYDNLEKVTTTIDADAKYLIGAEQTSTVNTMYYFNDIVDSQWGRMVTANETEDKPHLMTVIGTASAFTIQDQSGLYLAGATSKFSDMSETASTFFLNANSQIIYKPSTTSYNLRYNHNGGQTNRGLRWYDGTTGTPAYLYKVAMVYDNLTTDPSGTQIRPDAKVGMISGICYERDIVAHSGATFYYLSQKASDESYIELTEVTGILHAGYPYLFEASDNEIRVIFDGDAIEGDAYDYNGLYGTFVDQPLGDGYCIILNNKYYRTHTDNNNGCYNHRAYLKLDEVSTTSVENAPGETEQPVNAPRRIRMGGDGVNTPTGFDNIFGNDAEAIQKLIINNQLIIFRQGKRYNAAGALMK